MSAAVILKPGLRLPEATFYSVEREQCDAVQAVDFFAGRTVALFSVPGAFTPTCSSAHVPRFEALAQRFKAAGVDEIACLAVNDAFVLAAWQRQLGALQLRFLADPTGAFAQALGLLKDLGPLGLRSRRYSLVARDGVVEHCFVEVDRDGDPYEVSSADALLSAITGTPAEPALLLFAMHGCPHCAKLKSWLHVRGLNYECVNVGEGLTMQAVRAASGRSQVPQLFIDGRCVGGLREVEALAAQLPAGEGVGTADAGSRDSEP